MIHRRAAGSVSSPPNHQTPPPPPIQITPANTAFTPLKRRESANLYRTPQSAPKARYPIPSPSPSQLGPYGSGPGLMSPGYPGGVFDLNEQADETPRERILSGFRSATFRIGRGLEDAWRLDRSWSLVWGDPELRLVVLKSCMINLLSLFVLSFAQLVFSPLLQSSPSAIDRSKEIGLWYNVLFSWPVFVVCFWINASWGPEISRRATTLLHPSYRHQPPSSPRRASDTPVQSRSSEPSYLFSKAITSIRRIMLIGDFHLVGALLAYIPFVGRWLSFAYMCIITSHYCFEWNFISKGWTLDQRISYIQERTAYMLGFGFIATLVTSFGTTLVNMAIFALIYPFFVIQALLSRPPFPQKSTMLPGTPSPAASLPPSPSDGGGLSLQNPFFASSNAPNTAPVSYENGKWEFRVPIFYLARYSMAALDWFVAAILRDRVKGLGSRDRGKRAF